MMYGATERTRLLEIEDPKPTVSFADMKGGKFSKSAEVAKPDAQATKENLPVKIILLGDQGVGKTSCVRRYITKRFDGHYRWTVGVDFALKVVPWSNDVSIKLQLWDIAGQERFTSMTRVYYKDANACIIMFDLTQRSTFDNAVKWKKDLDAKCTLPDGQPVPCVLLANKCDLPYREVDQAEIEDFCTKQEFVGWTETSVKEGLMIEDAMHFLLEEVMKRHGEIEGSLSEDADDSPCPGGNIKLRPRPASAQQGKNKCSC